MSEHKVTLRWSAAALNSFTKNIRAITPWSFDGGHTMTATASAGLSW
jgi:hypothetical protein